MSSESGSRSSRKTDVLFITSQPERMRGRISGLLTSQVIVLSSDGLNTSTLSSTSEQTDDAWYLQLVINTKSISSIIQDTRATWSRTILKTRKRTPHRKRSIGL